MFVVLSQHMIMFNLKFLGAIAAPWNSTTEDLFKILNLLLLTGWGKICFGSTLTNDLLASTIIITDILHAIAACLNYWLSTPTRPNSSVLVGFREVVDFIGQVVSRSFQVSDLLVELLAR